ncbi:MAG: glycosyltransferase [Vicinamibacterales bacterium]
MTPRFSVVIPVLDMSDTIGPCLEGVLAQNLPRSQYEVIVVDNGLTDRTPDRVRQYPVTLLHEPAPGACSARNRGIAAARGRVHRLHRRRLRPLTRLAVGIRERDRGWRV